jgi:hypothetical protein
VGHSRQSLTFGTKGRGYSAGERVDFRKAIERLPRAYSSAMMKLIAEPSPT